VAVQYKHSHVQEAVGNIYADESLWRAGINPASVVSKIPNKELKKLYVAIITTLSSGIDFGGDSMSDYRNIHGERGKLQEQHRAYRKTGTKCSKKGCEGKIIRTVLGGRSTHLCDVHQKLFIK
jgi:formamidopyrimidine-DNA glycosylase